MSQDLKYEPEENKIDAFSPKRVLMLINQATRYLLYKWKSILLSGIVLGLVWVLAGLPNRPKYTAEFSFALDEGAVNSSTNNMSQLSEELGFGPSFEAGGVFSSMTNILELIQSRFLIEKTLKRSVSINDRKIIFADFFLDSLRFRNKWMKGSPFIHTDFSKSPENSAEEIFRNGIYGNMFSVIASRFIKLDKKGKGTTLISVTLTTENELFSKYFLEALIDEVNRFYVEMKTRRSKLHVDFIQRRTDSVKDAYMQSLYGRAGFSDANINPNLQTNIVPGERKQTDVVILRETYINLVKSLESAKTNLMQETPLFQYLDTPVLPLSISGGSLLMRFILFFLIGVLLSTVFLALRKFYRFVVSRPE